MARARRILIVFLALLIALLIWLQWGPGRPGSRSGGSGYFEPARGSAPELRIEIRETGAEADARHARILSRFGADPAALDWVRNCTVAGVDDGQSLDSETASALTRACWRRYADSHPEGMTDPAQ